MPMPDLNMCHHEIGGQFTKKRGSSQKILGDFTYNELSNYDLLKSVL